MKSPKQSGIERMPLYVDLPGLRTVDGIAEVDGNYPSAGVGEQAAWFRDSEGNLLGLGQPIRTIR